MWLAFTEEVSDWFKIIACMCWGYSKKSPVIDQKAQLNLWHYFYPIAQLVVLAFPAAVLVGSRINYVYFLTWNKSLSRFFQISSSSNRAGFGRQPAPLAIPNWSNLKPSLILLTIKPFHIYLTTLSIYSMKGSWIWLFTHVGAMKSPIGPI